MMSNANLTWSLNPALRGGRDGDERPRSGEQCLPVFRLLYLCAAVLSGAAGVLVIASFFIPDRAPQSTEFLGTHLAVGARLPGRGRPAPGATAARGRDCGTGGARAQCRDGTGVGSPLQQASGVFARRRRLSLRGVRRHNLWDSGAHRSGVCAVRVNPRRRSTLKATPCPAPASDEHEGTRLPGPSARNRSDPAGCRSGRRLNDYGGFCARWGRCGWRERIVGRD